MKARADMTVDELALDNLKAEVNELRAVTAAQARTIAVALNLIAEWHHESPNWPPTRTLVKQYRANAFDGFSIDDNSWAQWMCGVSWDIGALQAKFEGTWLVLLDMLAEGSGTVPVFAVDLAKHLGIDTKRWLARAQAVALAEIRHRLNQRAQYAGGEFAKGLTGAVREIDAYAREADVDVDVDAAVYIGAQLRFRGRRYDVQEIEQRDRRTLIIRAEPTEHAAGYIMTGVAGADDQVDAAAYAATQWPPIPANAPRPFPLRDPVHALHNGITLCGMNPAIAPLPKGHHWVGLAEDLSSVTCASCIAARRDLMRFTAPR